MVLEVMVVCDKVLPPHIRPEFGKIVKADLFGLKHHMQK